MGIRSFQDPGNAERIGYRRLSINVSSASRQAKYFVRIARSPRHLAGDFDLSVFAMGPSLPTIRAMTPLVRELYPQPNMEVSLGELTGTQWKVLYERFVRDNYDAPESDRLREYLLESRQWHARFVRDRRSGVLKQFIVRAQEFGARRHAFIFDNDPFGFQYRRPLPSRLISSLTHRQDGTIAYQWVKVGEDGDVAHGDIHVVTLPRPVNIAILGDSYTSGEGSPMETGGALPLWDSLWYGRWGHRSLTSGWERAVSGLVERDYSHTAYSLYNLSWSGATVSSQDAGELIGISLDDRADHPNLQASPTFLDAIDQLGFHSAARQVNQLFDNLHHHQQRVVDIVGLTLGGNDLQFAALVHDLFFEENDITIERELNGRTIDEWLDLLISRLPSLETLIAAASGGPGGRPVGTLVVADYPNPLGNARTVHLPKKVLLTHPEARGVDHPARESEEPRVTGGGFNIFAPLVDAGVESKKDTHHISAAEAKTVREEVVPRLQRLPALFAEHLNGLDVRVVRTTDVLPVYHGHGAWSGQPWFQPIHSLDRTTEIYRYALHPNAVGHERIYRPLYEDVLQELTSTTRLVASFREEARLPDLSIDSLQFRLENGRLVLDGRVMNVGGQVSSRARIHLHTLFDSPRGHGELALDGVTTPIRSEEGPVTIPPLGPGTSHRVRVILTRGRPLAIYDFIASQLVRALGDEGLTELIGPAASAEFLLRRLAVWGVLFDNPLYYQFEVVSDRRDMDRSWRNNWSDAASLEPRLPDTEAWLAAAHPKVYSALLLELGKKARLKTLTGLTALRVSKNKHLQQLFGLTGQLAVNRLNPGKRVTTNALLKYSDQLARGRRFGPLMQKMPVITNPMALDEIALSHPTTGESVHFSIASVDNLLATLRFDGRPLSAEFRAGLPGNSELPHRLRKWRTSRIQIVAPHYFTGISGYSRGAAPPRLPRVFKFSRPHREQVAIWRLIDPRTGIELASGLAADTLRLKPDQFLVHGKHVNVVVETQGRRAQEQLIYPFRASKRTGTVTQSLERVTGGHASVELLVDGATLSRFGKSIDVHFGQAGGPVHFVRRLPVKRRSSGGFTVTLQVPIDLIESGDARLLLSNRSATDGWVTSLDREPILEAIRKRVGELAPAEQRQINKLPSRWEVPIDGGGSYVVAFETSRDGISWTREGTVIASSGKPAVLRWGQRKAPRSRARAIVRRIERPRKTGGR